MASALWWGIKENRRIRMNSLGVSASYAARDISEQMQKRFDILEKLARDDTLHTMIAQLSAAENAQSTETAQDDLNNWLGARQNDHQKVVPAENWFINDRTGTQIARSPDVGQSLNKNYAHRDYFHGRGRDLPEGTAVTPITEPHRSAVYQSTSTGHLKVAFSVPIFDSQSGLDRPVIGVLAMSVDLGDFNVLENQLAEGHEVVLISLEEDFLSGETPQPGLILHHQEKDLVHLLSQQVIPRAGEDLLARINEKLSSPSGRITPQMLLNYRDPIVTGGKPYWGAIRLVTERVSSADASSRPWLVLVQEPK
jgi:hypothetical protein